MEQVELYRKYRPTSFAEIVGNRVALRAMMSEYKGGSHVFLFTGNAGCGKTTMANIMARQVLKSNQIIEINVADNRGIDTARDIMDRMRYPSIDGTPVVWILEEVQMQTGASQNALLRPLEETPPHVYFMLCTTNPEKLVAPLKTRCSIVNLQPLTEEEMGELLERVCEAESIELEETVRDRIISIANGGSRKALKLLSKVSKFTTEEDRLEAMKGELTLEMDMDTLTFCRALYKKEPQWTEIAAALKGLEMPGKNDPEGVRQAVLGYGAAILMRAPSKLVLQVMAAFSESTYTNGKFSIIMAAAEVALC